jgi:uncharacterized membrane protein YkvA (DUF1232 family)
MMPEANERDVSWHKRLREQARRLEGETLALYLAARDPRTPWYAKGWLLLVLAYALSPIDLVPDFIPVVGYLDDLVIVPLGIWIGLRMLPSPVLADARAAAQDTLATPGRLRTWGAVIIIVTWLLALALTALIVYRLFTQS